MKKSISFIVMLMSLTACTSQPARMSDSNSNGWQATEVPPGSTVVSINPTYSPLEGQINRPNKVFNTKVEKAVDADYVNALQQFTLDYYGLLDNNENQVFSPLSIATCYSMLYEGCDGKTRQELENMLHYDDSFNHIEEIQNMLLRCAINDSSNNTYLDIAQSVWLKHDGIFKQEYIDYLTNNYYAEAFENINFATTGKQLAAQWVNSKTNNFLDVKPSDFDTFNGLTAMVLFNTIYLKSAWAVENLFEETSNNQKEFDNRDGTTSTVTFMNGHINNSAYYSTDEYMISSLPYNHGMNLNILLPTSNNDAVLKDNDILNSLLNFKKLQNLETAKVVWNLPSFKMKSDYGLIPLLRQLGLEETFSQFPNFDRMVVPDYKDQLFIRESRHVAGIEVNNKGVEAAAYTYVQVDEKSAVEKTVRMNINHPFAYSITTQEGYPLFMGIVNQL